MKSVDELSVEKTLKNADFWTMNDRGQELIDECRLVKVEWGDGRFYAEAESWANMVNACG